jgi:hypothetical protein
VEGMKMKNEVKYGIIGIISILLGFGGNIYLTENELDNAYFCTATEEVGIFYGGISGTGLTAYPHTENRTEYVRCNNEGIKGVWILLKEYAEEQGISILEILNQQPEIEPETKNITKTITISYPNGRIYECYFINSFINNSIQSESKCKEVKNAN